MTTQFWCSVPEHSDCRHRCTLGSGPPSPHLLDLDDVDECMAEHCAIDFQRRYADRTTTWPMNFFIHLTENGEPAGMFSVDIKYSPQFSATRISPASEGHQHD